MTGREAVAEILLRRILTAEAEGFALLRKIPSGEVVRYLKYCAALGAAERQAFYRASAFRGTRSFGYRVDPNAHQDLLEPFERYRRHLNMVWDWDATDYRSLRTMRAILAQDPSSSLHHELPAAVKARIAILETAKAKDLRKAAKPAFAQLFGAKPANDGGEWVYSGELDGEPIEVEMEYGTMAAQVTYCVRMPAFEMPGMAGTNYELLLDAGLGWWDQIEQGREDRAIAVLCDLVRETVDICREVYRSGHAKAT